MPWLAAKKFKSICHHVKQLKALPYLCSTHNIHYLSIHSSTVKSRIFWSTCEIVISHKQVKLYPDMCCINKIFIMLTNYLYALNVKKYYTADYFPWVHIKQWQRAEPYQTSSTTPQASCRGTETMISTHLFFFVELSLTLGDYFTHLATTRNKMAELENSCNSGRAEDLIPL